jgi:hypothetical protein
MSETILNVGDGALLNLDGRRVVSLIDRGHTYTFHMGRITHADWAEYFDGIVHSRRNDGNGVMELLDLETPGILLVEKKLETTEGYRGNFMESPGWQTKIPPRHSRPVAWVLRTVANSEIPRDERSFDPNSVEVLLDAAWGTCGPGNNVLYKGLVHRFHPLSVQQKRRFYRATSMSRLVGGSRNGTTIYGNRNRSLVDIYDELIQEVEGYAVNGTPLGNSVDSIKKEMDLYHKVEAAQQLFSASLQESQQEDVEQVQ